MFGNWVRNRSGFSFIELIIALTIIGILASIAIPNFRARQPGYERRQFIDHLNALMQVALQNAIVTHKLHKVTFDLEKGTVSVDYQTDKKTASGDPAFTSMSSKYLNSQYSWPEETFEFKSFYVNKRDEMSLTLRGKKGKIWFFIVPDGLAQQVIINMIDLKSKGLEFSLILNPFSAQFKENDRFAKPE